MLWPENVLVVGERACGREREGRRTDGKELGDRRRYELDYVRGSHLGNVYLPYLDELFVN